MSTEQPTIIYTLTDEAPRLATASFLPIVRAFRPQVLITQHGADTHADDPLANLVLTVDAQRQAALDLHDLAHDVSEGKWVALGGGGYSVIDVVPRAWAHLTAIAMHTPIATLDKACLAAAKACELCPTVETASGVLRFWAMKVPDGELTGSVLLVGQGGGGKSGDGSYTLPTATPFRLGGVKVGDGLTVDNEGKLSVDAANTEETTGALNEVFGAEDGK